MKKKLFWFPLLGILLGCMPQEHLKTEILSDTCIRPLIDYHYLICKDVTFKVNGRKFVIPAHFETDLASIPKIAWSVMAPAHSSLIRPAIVHDWIYRRTCAFTRFQADIIFYHMLRNDGISNLRASFMYYSVRIFGWNYYNGEYCNDEIKSLDKESGDIQIASLFRHPRENDDWMGA